jgi:Protein of unknown function (DUF2523).
MALPVLALPVVAGVLVSVAKPIVQIVLRLVGFGLIAYVGFDLAFDQLKILVETYYSGLPSALLQLLDLMGVDSALQNIFATTAGLIAWKTLTNVVTPTWLKPGTGTITKEF